MTKAELEKEADKYFKSICGDYNEEYERTGKRHYWVGFDIKNAYLAGAEPREKRIADLEKENAELKEDSSEWEKASDKWKSVYELTNNQLTKAKEIIKNLLILKNDHYGNTKMEWRVKVTEQAEQFLNSEVEK